MKSWILLRCIGKAVLVNGGKILLNAVSGGVLGDMVEIVQDIWEAYQEEAKKDDATAELQALAQAPTGEVRKHAAEIAQEVAGGEPEEVRRTLANYLTQVPATVRRSLRRPSDPTGTTIPPGLVLREAKDLLPFLPTKLPRFREGDYPLASVDLELVELLGVGGFAEVWKARNPNWPNVPPVALKICLDAAAAASLRQEFALLTRVMQQGTYGGFVRLNRTYLRADPPCLEYEYVAGGDLTGLIHEWHRAGGVTPQRAAKVMLRLAQIVGYAHRLNPPIVHRDLKPANILVQKTDEDKYIFKVADFGIGGVAVSQAIAASHGETTRGLAAAAVAQGSYTPLYASPQQMAGGNADPRDDVHALGVVWYQLLTGDLLRSVGVDYADDMREVGLGVPFIELLGKCVAWKAERRPADARALADQLEALLKPAAATVGRPLLPNKGQPSAARMSEPPPAGREASSVLPASGAAHEVGCPDGYSPPEQRQDPPVAVDVATGGAGKHALQGKSEHEGQVVSTQEENQQHKEAGGTIEAASCGDSTEGQQAGGASDMQEKWRRSRSTLDADLDASDETKENLFDLDYGSNVEPEKEEHEDDESELDLQIDRNAEAEDEDASDERQARGVELVELDAGGVDLPELDDGCLTVTGLNYLVEGAFLFEISSRHYAIAHRLRDAALGLTIGVFIGAIVGAVLWVVPLVVCVLAGWAIPAWLAWIAWGAFLCGALGALVGWNEYGSTPVTKSRGASWRRKNGGVNGLVDSLVGWRERYSG